MKEMEKEGGNFMQSKVRRHDSHLSPLWTIAVLV